MAVRCRVSDADVAIVTNLFSLDVARALRERRAREGLHGALDLWAEAGHEPGLAPRKRVLIRALRSLRTHGGVGPICPEIPNPAPLVLSETLRTYGNQLDRSVYAIY